MLFDDLNLNAGFGSKGFGNRVLISQNIVSGIAGELQLLQFYHRKQRILMF